MIDWDKIEREFKDYNSNTISYFDDHFKREELILEWFKSRLESEYPPIEKLSEKEANEFYTTNVTAEIKPNYGK